VKKYRKIFFRNVSENQQYFKVLAWYRVTDEGCSKEILSFPWVISEVLLKHYPKIRALYKSDCVESPETTPFFEQFARRGIGFSRLCIHEGIIFVDDPDETRELFNEGKAVDYIIREYRRPEDTQSAGEIYIFVLGGYERCVELEKQIRLLDKPLFSELFLILFAFQLFSLKSIVFAIDFISALVLNCREKINRSAICDMLVDFSGFSYDLDNLKKKLHFR
jgi:hypothetical protein